MFRILLSIFAVLSGFAAAQEQKRPFVTGPGQPQRTIETPQQKREREAREARALDADRANLQKARQQPANGDGGPDWGGGASPAGQASNVTVLTGTTNPIRITQRMNQGTSAYKSIIANTTGKMVEIRAWREADFRNTRDGGNVFKIGPFQEVGLPMYHLEKDRIFFMIMPQGG